MPLALAIAACSPSGNSASPTATSTPSGSSSSTTAPTATTTPPTAVAKVLGGDSFEISRPSGTRVVRLLGIAAPTATGGQAQCWAAEARAAAASLVEGKEITLDTGGKEEADPEGRLLARARLADGRDLAEALVAQGAARVVAGTLPADRAEALRKAEESARSARAGLWGEPCQGGTALPTPPPPATTPPPAPVATQPPPPPPAAHTPPPAPQVYYKNCAEVRAAGAAPLHRGDPGYAKHLDRDGDGVACER
ncbi:thermonuclease family protein [Streptoalloteichus tenebrarius]|uniref:thermonuclease family protein n=1 Tax=Streptoalloteichus tenebrarius (strain ATCC 17920 / DSM 40477 / JCM 4838 / CBS 697.72 / NBRC 16177 / NCIMB 11028 / NRRL B-12390 / A12253. 1 / ISP 5477) TaxID=1933 RepID=UPI0020A37026|nr:excalibur calcium-binding domain-containing protein [Streptoalloteichus tenebrarius]BFF04086.1 excalibur calcium-binding domain-containing protein [Streptoalloteichus tenebrarius]